MYDSDYIDNAATDINDPYYDENADVNNDNGTELYKDDIPFIRTLKHVGDSLKKGGFCSTKKEEKSKSSEGKAVNVTFDATLDTSMSDGSQCLAEPSGNVKSVSFSANEPLILDDLDVHDNETTEPSEPEKSVQNSEKSEQQKRSIEQMEPSKSSKVTIQSVKKEQKLPSTFKSMPTFLIFIAVVVAVYKSDISCLDEVLNPAINGFETYVQPHSSMLRIEDIKNLVSKFFGTMLFLAFMRYFVASEKRVKASIEFVWGTIVCTVVIIGIYFTYSLAAK